MSSLPTSPNSSNHPLPTPPEPQNSSVWTNRRIIWLAATVVLVAALIWRAPEEARYIGEHAGEILITIVMAMSITYLLRPLVNALQKFPVFGGKTPETRHRGRGLAVIFVFLCIGLAFYLLILVGLNPITRDAAEMWRRFVPDDPTERSRFFVELSSKVQAAINTHLSWAGPEVSRQVQISVTDSVNDGVQWAKDGIRHVFQGAGFLVELLLIPVLVFYFLCDGPAIRQEAKLLVPLEWRPRAARMAAHLDRVFDGYIRGQALMCVIAWILVTLMLLALGVRYPFTLGIIAGLTRAVPVIGPLLGAIPLALVCFLTTGSVSTTTLLLVGFTLMHFLESKVLLPRVVGHEVDLHPVTVIIALLIGMEFFGFIGVFLAVPLAAILKIVLAEWHAGRQTPVIMTTDTGHYEAGASENGLASEIVKEKVG
ncbi:MAG TPA: AI-2E family transporter [Abditibacteriaceae bacterium]|jgi:predicted PurR-regulated permease PerM